MDKRYVKSFLLLFSLIIFLQWETSGQAISENDSIIKIQGSVYDIQTREPVKASLTYQMIPFGSSVGIASSDPETGAYFLYMINGKQYTIEIIAKGYLSHVETLTVEDYDEDRIMGVDFELMPITIGRVMTLNKLFFVQSKAEITEDSYPQLNILVKMLEDYPSMVIQLEGHTDYRGSSKLNMELSEARVDAIQKYLVKNGIRKSRIKTKAYGGSNPITTEATEEAQSRNRRVEVRILKN